MMELFEFVIGAFFFLAIIICLLGMLNAWSGGSHDRNHFDNWPFG